MKEFIVKRPKGYVLHVDQHSKDVDYADSLNSARIFRGPTWYDFWSYFDDAELLYWCEAGKQWQAVKSTG